MGNRHAKLEASNLKCNKRDAGHTPLRRDSGCTQEHTDISQELTRRLNAEIAVRKLDRLRKHSCDPADELQPFKNRTQSESGWILSLSKSNF
jgi:hypothetical protein